MIHKNRVKEILTLYKTSLKIAKEVGYVPGDWRKNSYIHRNYIKLSITKRKEIIYNLKQKDIGAFVAWNIRQMYKNNKHLRDEKKINDSIDYGYHFIRKCPSFLFPYCKEYLIDLWCYN